MNINQHPKYYLRCTVNVVLENFLSSVSFYIESLRSSNSDCILKLKLIVFVREPGWLSPLSI